LRGQVYLLYPDTYEQSIEPAILLTMPRENLLSLLAPSPIYSQFNLPDLPFLLPMDTSALVY
jgi:hypothetical protein